MGVYTDTLEAERASADRFGWLGPWRLRDHEWRRRVIPDSPAFRHATHHGLLDTPRWPTSGLMLLSDQPYDPEDFAPPAYWVSVKLRDVCCNCGVRHMEAA